jgi:Ca-activated chloride channel family protein
MAVDRDRYRAQEWLAKIEARGGTELAAPLDQAIRLLASPATPDTDRVLVLLTDGQVGNEDQILKALAKRIKGLRAFTLGIDQAVNDAFLRRLAGLGGGYCEVVESEDRLDAVMAKVHRRIRSPLLSSLSLTAEGVRFIEDESVPRQLPDLFPGAPLTVMGRYAGSPSGSVTLNATDDAGQPWHQAVRGTATANDAIHLSWARARVRELEDRFVSGMGNTATLEKLILATSLTHGVLCRFTAFVAVDVKEVVNEGGEVRRVTQPVELPAGWTMPIDLMAMPMTGALRAGGSGMARCYAPPSVAPAAPALGAFSDAEETVLDSDLAEMPASRSEGIIDRLAEKAKQIFRSRTPRTTAPAGAGIDLSAYRRRVAEMLDQINKATDIVRALGTLAIQLEALIDDLKSIGVSDNQTKPLADLLREFCEWLAKAKATPGIDVASMVERCREVLGAFAKG